MTNIYGNMKFCVDENEANKLNKVKQLGPNLGGEVKRSALGDLQNRTRLCSGTGKDIRKELKDSKIQNAIRATKARVDTHWKKAPNNVVVPKAATNQLTNATNATAQCKVLRSNSLRTNPNAGLNNGTQKPKTLTTKIIETKVTQKVLVNKKKAPAEDKIIKIHNCGTLRHEESNLLRKSLTKLKPLTREIQAKPVTSTTVAVIKNDVAGKPNANEVSSDVSSNRKLEPKAHSTRMLDHIEDIDAADKKNLMLVSEYVKEIYEYLFDLEKIHAIGPNHLVGQEEVYPKMRSVLIDWINEVHLQFRLAAETFQMSVSLIDRYLKIVKDTKRSQLQLVGVTALFIASKYEELFPSAIADFVYITDNTYTAKDILKMEIKILKTLDINLSPPLPIHFLRRFSKAAKAEDEHHTMSKYFLELALIEYELLAYKPSEIAAASLFLALNLLNGDFKVKRGLDHSLWKSTLHFYSRYNAEHLEPIAKKIAGLVRNAPTNKLQSVFSKYESIKFQKIAVRPEIKSPLMDSIIGFES